MESIRSLFKTLSRAYSFTEYDQSGRSLLGRELSLLHVGTGKKAVLMTAGADATDGISDALLLCFAKDLCLQIAQNSTVYGINCAYLAENRRILILPRWNPDGRSLVTKGPDPDSPLYERQLRQNGMKSDFSAWRGNARGVYPHLNFNDDFAKRRAFSLDNSVNAACITGEFPESEPECAFIARLVRTLCPVFVLECQKGDADVLYTNRKHTVRRIAHSTACTVSEEHFYGLSSWFSQSTQLPGVHLICQEPTPSTRTFYHRFREFFFRSLYTLAV